MMTIAGGTVPIGVMMLSIVIIRAATVVMLPSNDAVLPSIGIDQPPIVIQLSAIGCSGAGRRVDD